MPAASFAPVVVDATTPALPSPLSHSNSAVPAEIEITAGLVVIRVRGSVDMKMLTAVLRAVKAAS